MGPGWHPWKHETGGSAASDPWCEGHDGQVSLSTGTDSLTAVCCQPSPITVGSDCTLGFGTMTMYYLYVFKMLWKNETSLFFKPKRIRLIVVCQRQYLFAAMNNRAKRQFVSFEKLKWLTDSFSNCSIKYLFFSLFFLYSVNYKGVNL